MNELANNRTNIITRTSELIAAEINSIKNQTRRMMIYNSIEIGRRLVEAKELVPHGEWGKWLEEKVDYSQRTANNLMRIFEQYGAEQLTLLEDNSKSQSLANLSYTQAVALLGVPEEEREQFIEDHDIENMSTRELQKAIKEREQALKEKEELEQKLKAAVKEADAHKRAHDAVSRSYDRLSETNEEHYVKSEQLKKELEDTKKQLEKAKEAGNPEEVVKLQETLQKNENNLAESYRKIADLERKLREKPIEVKAETIVEKVPEEVEKELNELRKKTQSSQATVKFSFVFDDLVKKFKELLSTLAEIKETDKEKHEKYRNAVKGLLNKMGEGIDD